METEWVNGFRIRCCIDGTTAVLSANREGLLSLARHLTALAQERPGSHIHYDQFNSLEADSNPLIVERID
ncbi:MAG: hypothetical protein IIY90_01215 [Oscillospiraceae bacterium]|nr:hypothetical protein [Oscillospiraceae bacterium]